MAQKALFWCPERKGAQKPKGSTSLFWNNWRASSSSPCVISFWSPWSEEQYILAGDDEIDLKFEMIGGSDCPQFQLVFRHISSDAKSFFSYHAWSRDHNSEPRPVVTYPEAPPPGPYTFSTSLMYVKFERRTRYSSDVEKVKTWAEKSSTYPLVISWTAQEPPVGISTTLTTNSWSSSSRAKFTTWQLLKDPCICLKVAVIGGGRLGEGWSFFASQPSPTLPPWWRYSNPTHQNQRVVIEVPDLSDGSELLQYHQRTKQERPEVVPMTYLDTYKAPIEYEVFAVGSLMRSVEYARDTYESAFNRIYDFSLDSVDVVYPEKRGCDTYFVQLEIDPWILKGHELAFGPSIGVDVRIRAEGCTFVGRILSSDNHTIIMEVRRTEGTGAMILNNQRGYFEFGNPYAAYRAIRQAIRGLMWGRVDLPQDNWMKDLLLAHENVSMIHQSIGTASTHPPIHAHDRLNEDQKEAFVNGKSFGTSLRSRLTIIEGPPGTGKTSVIIALIIRAMACRQKILVCTETNYAVRLCAGMLNTYLKRRNLPSDGVYLVQRDALQALGKTFGEEIDDQNDEHLPEYLTERTRLHLAERLEKDVEFQDFSLSNFISSRLRYIRNPDHRGSFTDQERALLSELNMSRKLILQTNTVPADEVIDEPTSTATEPSVEMISLRTPQRIVGEDPQKEQNSIRKAQKLFDSCWLKTCRHYIAKSTQVVFVTAATSTCKLLTDFTPSTIIVDEASQMTEINTITVVAKFFPGVEKLILVGDLKQNSLYVGSSNRNEFAKSTERSLMERMMLTGVPSKFLSVQYRMHPHISSTVSKHFYDGRMTDGANVFDRPQDHVFQQFLTQNMSCERHSVFLHVEGGQLYSVVKGGSKVNPQFATAAQQMLRGLLAAGAAEKDIGLVTFYKAQLHIYQELSSPLVNTMTVDACRGHEFDFVIVDTVTPGGRDYGLGFLTDLKNINVALSRAKHGLIIIGSQDMGKVGFANNGAKTWQSIIQDHAAQAALLTMTVNGEEIKKQFDIPGQHYKSAYRNAHG